MSSPDPDELARALAAIEHRGQVNAALSDAAGEAGTGWVFDLGSVACSALRETGRIAALEAQLAANTPAAAARLRLVADTAAMGLAEVVAHTARALLADAAGSLGGPDDEGEPR